MPTQPPRPRSHAPAAAQPDRDLHLLIAAVSLCALTGVVAITAAVGGTTSWPAFLTVAAIAAGACLTVTAAVRTRAHRTSDNAGLSTPPGVG